MARLRFLAEQIGTEIGDAKLSSLSPEGGFAQ
jgi:hypothetical protein